MREGPPRLDVKVVLLSSLLDAAERPLLAGLALAGGATQLCMISRASSVILLMYSPTSSTSSIAASPAINGHVRMSVSVESAAVNRCPISMCCCSDSRCLASSSRMGRHLCASHTPQASCRRIAPGNVNSIRSRTATQLSPSQSFDAATSAANSC